MARPWRRVIVELAIRLNKLPREIESLTIPEVRELVAMLTRKSKSEVDEPETTRQQSPEEVERGLRAAFGAP